LFNAQSVVPFKLSLTLSFFDINVQNSQIIFGFFVYIAQRLNFYLIICLFLQSLFAAFAQYLRKFMFFLLLYLLILLNFTTIIHLFKKRCRIFYTSCISKFVSHFYKYRFLLFVIIPNNLI